MSSKKVKTRGMSGTAKWIITMLVFLAAVATVYVCWSNGIFHFQPGSVQANDEAVPETVAPTESAEPEEEKIQHKIFVSCGKGGSAEPGGCVYVEDWDSTTIYFTPDEGYRIRSVTVDGTEMGAVAAYTLSYVKEDHVVIAGFEKIPEATPTPELDDGGEDYPGTTEYFGDD